MQIYTFWRFPASVCCKNIGILIILSQIHLFLFAFPSFFRNFANLSAYIHKLFV